MCRSERRAHSNTILIVEDEELLRMLAVDALRAARYEVLEAGHAGDALDILRVQARSIHALFTDVHMPGPMNGVALAHETRRCWPWVHLLIASGQLVPHPSELPTGSRFLPKPYELHHVLGHLGDMLSL